MRVWFGISFGNNADRMKTRELNVIKSHIFIRWQRWKTYSTWKKLIPICLFHLFCPLKSHSALWRQLSGFGTKTYTHTSCIGNLCPFPDWCLATRSQTHNVNTEGFPVFSGGHLWPLFLLHFLSFVYYRSIFFQFPPTHPLSSSRRRARLCFERMRHHWWRSHPTHQQ